MKLVKILWSPKGPVKTRAAAADQAPGREARKGSSWPSPTGCNWCRRGGRSAAKQGCPQPSSGDIPPPRGAAGGGEQPEFRLLPPGTVRVTAVPPRGTAASCWGCRGFYRHGTRAGGDRSRRESPALGLPSPGKARQHRERARRGRRPRFAGPSARCRRRRRRPPRWLREPRAAGVARSHRLHAGFPIAISAAPAPPARASRRPLPTPCSIFLPLANAYAPSSAQLGFSHTGTLS